MIKDIIDANNNVTVGAKEIEILKEHFPACFRNGSFDIERLKEYLKDKIHVTEEGYELRFLGKNYARLLASLDTTTVIVPDTEHNNLPENKDSKNIYISGDNLDALKHLLKSYAGSIKCIYIDPPYNTGSDDFVYTDSFNFTIEELASKLSISEEQASRVLDLTRRGSATHSAWLMFMLPRLLLARDLLSKDGVIFISIDENEHANLRLLCEEIFGEENSAGEIVWKNSSKNDEDYISMQHEYILCFVKNKTFNGGDWHEAKEGVQEIFTAFAGFRKKYGTDWKAIHAAALDWYKQFKASDPISDSSHYSWMDERGVYFPDNIAGPNFGQYVYDVIHPITGKVCKAPASGWRFPEETMKEKIADGLIHFGEDETTVPNKKTYLKDTLNQSLTSIKYRDGRVASKRLTSYVLNKFNYIENYATGLKKTLAAYEPYSFRPKYESTEHFFVVILPNVNWTGEETIVPENVPENVPEHLSADAVKVMNAIRRDPEITKEALAVVIGKTTKTVGRRLAELKKNGCIERIGSDRKGYWKVLK